VKGGVMFAKEVGLLASMLYVAEGKASSRVVVEVEGLFCWSGPGCLCWRVTGPVWTTKIKKRNAPGLQAPCLPVARHPISSSVDLSVVYGQRECT
jgi:hypothetical protein